MEYKLVSGEFNSFNARINELAKKGWRPVGNHTAIMVVDRLNNYTEYSILMMSFNDEIPGMVEKINEALEEAYDVVDKD